MFYLLDTIIQDPIKLGFTVLQNLIFQDKNNNPGDLINVFTSEMAEYNQIINEQFVI
jgi:hypothetical protein